MKHFMYGAAALFVSFSGFSQAYNFQTIKEINCLPIISQGNTGTCWSYSSTSFLEAEILRKTGKTIDLSEMYNVRHTYPKKAWVYIMRQGAAQFGEGGLNHDVINSAKSYGLVPLSAYSGLQDKAEKHDHSKMVEELEKIVKANTTTASKTWKNEVNAILDQYLGKDVTEFTYEGKSYTPKTFMEMTKLKMDDYVTISSFSHEPYYSTFVLDVPDNFSNGRFYNLPLDEFIQNIDNALANGYTLALDADVSEKTFSSKNGIAVIPQNMADEKAILTEIKPEMKITTELRQEEFENFNTQDDHLMHIVGQAKDQKGTMYYKVKNSWGTEGSHDGFIYMSVPYMRLKAISVLLHKDALLKKTKSDLKV